MPRPNILLVDDSLHFLEVEKHFLQQCAVMIHTACNGREALDIVRMVKPDLIYLDLYMPVMDGAECCAALKADPDLRSIPVIILTAGNEEDERRVYAAGCDFVLKKPVDRKTFVECGVRFLPGFDATEMRVECETHVLFETQGKTFYGTGVNISGNGMYVAAEAEVFIDDPVAVSFVLPREGTFIDAHGRVAWINRGRHRRKKPLPDGFGIEFATLSPEVIEAIERYIGAFGEESFPVIEDAYVATPP